MKKHSRIQILRGLLVLILCLTLCQSALADVLTLPSAVSVIEEEAFRGNTSLDEIVLPEGIERIESKYARSCLMVAPSGFTIQLTRHIRNHD